MPGYIYLIQSFLMVLFSSYIFVRLLKPEKLVNFILYIVLVMISQVICTSECLSILNCVTPLRFLLANFAVFIVSFFFLKFNKNPHIDFAELRCVLKKIINAIKQDKILFFLFILFIYSSHYHFISSFSGSFK